MQIFLTRYRPYLWLSLFCALLYLPGISSIPPVDRDEARYVQATKQMVETNDFVNIRFQDKARNKKPAGIYWLQSFMVKTFAKDNLTSMVPYRMVSVIGAWLAVLLSFFFGQFLHDRRASFLGAGFLASSLLLTVEAHLAKTDAFMLFTSVLTQGALAVCYLKNKYKDEMGHFLLRSNWIIAFLFWFGFGLSILIKGPVVPLICLLTVLCLTIWDKDAKWLWQLKPVFGIIIVTAMVYPWLNAINQSTGGAFLKDSIGKDLIPKLLGGVESHGAYFGYYTLLVTLTLWPCSMFMWPALWGIKRDREIPAIRFSIAWILPAWLLFELIPTKLPHYVLPLYPALTFATGVLLSTAWRTTEPLFLLKKARIWYVIWYVFSIILGVGIFLIPIKLGSGYNNFAVVGCGVMVISLALTINWRNKMLYFQASIASIVGAIAMFSVTYGALLPNLDVIWISKRVKNIVTQEEKPIASVGFHEPSLVFLNGTKTNLTTFDKAYKHFQKHPKSVILVARKHKKQFLSSMKKHNIKVEATNSVDGINYSRGDEIVLDFYKRKIENR